MYLFGCNKLRYVFFVKPNLFLAGSDKDADARPGGAVTRIGAALFARAIDCHVF